MPTDLSRKVEVISVGFSRTGTLSYARAYEILLDGPTFHGGEQLLRREDGQYATKNKLDFLDTSCVSGLTRNAGFSILQKMEQNLPV